MVVGSLILNENLNAFGVDEKKKRLHSCSSARSLLQVALAS